MKVLFSIKTKILRILYFETSAMNIASFAMVCLGKEL